MLPVGGIKEKVLAARRAGVHEVIMPKQNEKNVNEDLTEELKQGLVVHYVDDMDEVLRLALAAPAEVNEIIPHEEPQPGLTLA